MDIQSITGFLTTVFYFIVAIFILVTVHEFGHFAAAKLFGMRVHKFYIGFDFWNLKLWSTQRGETEYGIGAIPLGGYVQIAGMVDESMDTDFANQPPQPWEFRSKPVWQRLIVISAGVIMNMVLAAVIFIYISLGYGEVKTPISTGAYISEKSVFEEIGLRTGDKIIAIGGKSVKYWQEVFDPEVFSNGAMTYTVNRNGEILNFTTPANIMTRMNEAKGEGLRPLTAPIVGDLVSDAPAQKLGLQKGDIVTKLDGKDIFDWSQLTETVGANKEKTISIEWKRGNEIKTGSITPTSYGKIGIAIAQQTNSEYTELAFFPAIGAGLQQTWKMTVLTVKGFGRLLTGQEDVSKSVGGPIKIAKMAGQMAQQGAASFLLFLAVLSISLAFLNILPVPALDGGQFVMNAVEGVIGKELPLKIKMGIQQAGMVMLLLLMVFIVYNDIAHP